MKGFKAKVRVAVVAFFAIAIGLAGLYGLLKPISNGCVMTYMYPTYIPISTPENVSSTKYGLYLYHEGWKKIDFVEHLKNLNGIPVLFIPGNGGSYKQVRSLGAESDRAYQNGPLDRDFYQDFPYLEEGEDADLTRNMLPNQYTSMLDWFAVDLEGEHSAMDGRILQEHSEYVVHAIHRILDQYKESQDARAKEGAALSGSLPKSVILVGHSMGGFVARAAVVHPRLRKSAVETILTLSSPHQSPPVALQPSLGQYYSHVNQEWRKGYEVQTSRSGRDIADPLLSHVVIVSISGGYNDYQARLTFKLNEVYKFEVRTKLESLDGIVPPSHGFMISSTAIKNVWLSMEHQVILWCNQLVVQVSHTLLSLVDTRTGKPFHDVRSRLAVFIKMLHSGIPQNIIPSRYSTLRQKSDQLHNGDRDVESEVFVGCVVDKLFNNLKLRTEAQALGVSGCPSNLKWSEDGLEKDLYIQTSTVTVLAMDGRRRWLDIHKLGADEENHFVFVTNLAPCSGVRLHLWPEKGTLASKLSMNNHVLEITSKMVHIPSRPAPRQIEPGSQTEQAPPSAFVWLGPQDLHGFRFLTISVAPRPTVSGRPPPATSMGVGQFFNPKNGEQVFPPHWLIHSSYLEKEITLKEDHPLAFNLTFSLSLGLLPISLSVKTTSCGIRKSEFPGLEPGDTEIGRVCRLRCFPPVALAWDSTSGLQVFPNLYSEIVTVDSSPALWTSSQESDKTAVLLLVDPHCSYKAAIGVSVTAGAGRFLLLYFSQICGLSVAVIFFALMRQAHAWEFDQPIPSLLSAVESNLRLPRPFFFLASMPPLFALLFSWLNSEALPPVISFIIVSMLCYIFANGAVILLISLSQLLFYIAGAAHVVTKRRWQAWEGNFCFQFLQWFSDLSSRFASTKVVRLMMVNSLLLVAFVAVVLACFFHPALGLFILFLYHILCCHGALSSHVQNEEIYESGDEGKRGSIQYDSRYEGDINMLFDGTVNCSSSPESTRSYSDRQLETFNHRHGLLILHLLAALMFVPSLVAWLQRIGTCQNFPRFLDSLLSTGVILHGICDSKPELNFFWFPIPGFPLWEIRLSFGYLLAGYFSFISAMALAPYMVFYPMAAIGVVSFTFRVMQRRNIKNGETYHGSRKHSHRH
ncbi:hypothetical protein F511_18251 [Dorcoceras hygrometricum]|uniref:GPI inositol-deacylase n=1 Tax=Dorcoceras hygrometricum TaxID=472368 RepID=A0A2Z7AE62_9LAMI|nr:hypothetical protein F511_18251 [Dorcoceras hygrometricum]